MALLAGLAVLALLVRLVPVLRGGGLYGDMTYDDGVYFGSAVALVHGRIPYRDFLLLHPPGIVYLLAPFAALGGILGDANAFALARVGFMGLGALNTVLVTLVAARLGRRAALMAGASYAVWEVAANVERTTWLIAPQSTLTLLALLALAWPARARTPLGPGPIVRRATAAGALLGLAFDCQIWGAVPLAIVFVWLVLTARRNYDGWLRPTLAYLGAAIAAVGLVWLPFLAVAAPQLVRYVIFDQLGRQSGRGSVMTHLRLIEGIPAEQALARLVPDGLVVLAFCASVVAVGWATWRRPPIRLWAALLAGQAALLFLTPPLVHYSGWLAPTASLVIGGTVSAIAGQLRPAGRPLRAFGAACALGLAAWIGFSALHSVGTRLDVAGLTAALADARCVTTDSPVLLIETEALHRDLVAGCPLLLDPTGTSYDTDRGRPRSRLAQPAYQAAMVAYYGGSDAAMFARRANDRFQAGTWRAILRALPIVTRVGAVSVLRRPAP